MKIHGPGWEEVCLLDSGGQGKVFKVRSPESVKDRKEHLLVIRRKIRECNKSRMEPDEEGEQAAIDLVSAIDGYASQEKPAHFGALKLFDIAGDGREAQKAKGRLQSEVNALNEISHPSILKLLHADVPSRMMITEFHPNGTLAANRDRFRGNVRASIEAFRPLVEAVAILHARNPKIIHRDIKPKNIFVASDGRLVLGDFGIVFFQDEVKERLTFTYSERVGTADWMAPWANVWERLEEPNPTFDIFPLGKILWWMISGKTGLPYWYHRKPDYNLEIIFKRHPEMALVNTILDSCVVEEEKDCLSDAKSLLAKIDDVLKVIRGGRQPWNWDDAASRPCNICESGQYERTEQKVRVDTPGHMATVFRCKDCGHIQLFTRTT